MFQETTRQLPLLDNSLQLHPSARARLEGSWADGFRRRVLPLLLEVEPSFACLYKDVGRPNWSVARALGCLVVMEMFNQHDQEVLDSLSFDCRYQHALGMAGHEAYLSRRSLVDFRSRLVDADPDLTLLRALFDKVFAVAKEAMGTSIKQQRVDSTFISSNIRIRGRLGLFRQTLKNFVRWLSRTHEETFQSLDAELRQWYEEFDDSWEDTEETKGQKREIKRLADFLYGIVTRFAEDDTVCSQEPYTLVKRVFEEQCVLVESVKEGEEDGEDGSRVEVEVRETMNKKGGALRSPYDPDATTGHKGCGYHAHFTETCGNSEGELLTDFSVNPADRPDTGQTTAILERLAELDRKPETMYADGGYPTPASLAEAEAMETRLVAPVTRSVMAADKMTRLDFKLNAENGNVVKCPQGHEPTRHGYRKDGEKLTLHAFFDGPTCCSCPVQKQCPVRSPGADRPTSEFRLELTRGLQLRDELYVAQRTEEWKAAYRTRSGSEATMSEMKRAHGVGRLRVRRRSRVLLAVSAKAIGCNVKRWLKWEAAKGRQEALELATARNQAEQDARYNSEEALTAAKRALQAVQLAIAGMIAAWALRLSPRRTLAKATLSPLYVAVS